MKRGIAYDILVEAIDFSDYGNRKKQRTALKTFRKAIKKLDEIERLMESGKKGEKTYMGAIYEIENILRSD